MGIKLIAACGIVSGFIIPAAIAAPPGEPEVAPPVLAQGQAHDKVTMSSEDFARNRASFVEGQTVEIQLCRAEGALMLKFDCIVQDGSPFPVTWPKEVSVEERNLCELSYAHNVRRSYNVEVCNFVVTGTVGVVGEEIGIRASEVKWRDGRNLADEKVRRASETLLSRP
jgi:hypothetical protein